MAGQRRVYAFDDELRLKWMKDLSPIHPDLGFGLALLHADAEGVVLADETERVIVVDDGEFMWITNASPDVSAILAATRAANRTVYFTASGPTGLSLRAVRPR